MSTVFEQQASTILDFNLEEGDKSYTISNSMTGDVLYEVDRHADSTMTIFRRPGQNIPFAVYERREILSDKITFSGGDSKSLKDWLNIKRSSLVATLKEKGKEYTWMKPNNGPINLISSDTNKRIACFRLKHSPVIGGTVENISQPYLIMQPEAEEIMDAVVVAAVVLQQHDRWVRRNDEWSASKAGAAGRTGMIGAVFAY